MQKEKSTYIAWPLIMVLLSIAGLPGCGGGGKGGATPASASLVYTGSSAAATIALDNAKAISSGAVNGTSATASGTGTALLGVQAAGGSAGEPSLVQVVEKVATQVTTAETTGATLTGVVTSGNTLIQGPCGGSVSATAASGGGTIVNGTLSFDNYCDTGIVFVSGDLAFSADVNGSVITSLSISTSASAQLSVLTRRTGMVFKIDSLDLTATLQGGSNSVSVSGRFYHPTYGYVELSTPSNLVILAGDIFPMGGQLLLTDASMNHALITALSSSTYQLQVDANADGAYEDTTTGTWSSL